MSNRVNIEKELKEMAPMLSVIPFVQPYKIPNGYFESLRCDVLNEIGVKNVYKVPEGYFEQFQVEVLQKIHKQKTKIRHMSSIRYIIGIAASVLLLISIGIWYEGDKIQDFDFVSEEVNSEYMLSHIDDYNLEEIFDDGYIYELTIDNLDEEDVENFIHNNIEAYDLEELSELL